MPAFFKSLLLLLLVTIGLACPPRAALAQKAVLYEENPAGQHGKRFVGTVIWRSETVSPGLGQQPEHVISADIEVPERDLAATWLLHRNNDRNLSATHVVEITFKLPAGDPHGGVSAVAGLLMRQNESVRGVPSTRGVPFVA